ncbi:MAG: hypothetical protein ACUZ8E_17845 [Candidatus Anammoxibacter sp.]
MIKIIEKLIIIRAPEDMQDATGNFLCFYDNKQGNESLKVYEKDYYPGVGVKVEMEFNVPEEKDDGEK